MFGIRTQTNNLYIKIYKYIFNSHHMTIMHIWFYNYLYFYENTFVSLSKALHAILPLRK